MPVFDPELLAIRLALEVAIPPQEALQKDGDKMVADISD
jgi:hypothetical protein